jgi:hypothetical protein
MVFTHTHTHTHTHKQTQIPMGKNRKPIYKSTQLLPPNFLTKMHKSYNGKKRMLNKCCWENWISASRKLKLDPCFSTCSNINSKLIKNLNWRYETLKLP